MLKITKQIQITGICQIGGEQAVYMSATLHTNGDNANINKSITNKKLYDENKAEIRKDMTDFESAVYQIEDEIGGVQNV